VVSAGKTSKRHVRQGLKTKLNPQGRNRVEVSSLEASG
jgi:hypothetical protein